ncbi:MAG: amino acid ABC transporter permease [Frankia sp.]|nr:amino acid ABC transporter permease [Frankia sp.]
MHVVLDNLGLFWSGLWLTLQLTALSFLLALLVGTVVATMRVSPAAPLRAAGLLYVEAVRNTPPLVLLLLFVYGLPKTGVTYSLYVSAVIVLGGYTGAFVAEAVRSGINTVPLGQAEAARSLGFGFGQTLRLVVLPQAFRAVIPPLGGLLSALVRNTSLAAVIGLLELTAQAGRLNTEHTEPIWIYLAAAAAYLVVTLPLGALTGALERRAAVAR